MSEWWSGIATLVSGERLLSAIRALVVLISGFVVAKLVSMSITRMAKKYLTTHQAILVRRITYYLVLVLFIITALRELGFNLSVVLGAAGILSVAVGFASQTSASNLISGVFLLGEQPFSIGDVIKVGETVGEVLAIDLLSVKLRTFDNLYVRLPNETLLKSEVTTLTKFPIRRIDLQIGIAYKEDIGRVRDILFEVADRNPLCLEEPKPLFIMQGFGESSMDLQFSVWAKRESFLNLKNSIYEEIKIAFDANGIEIPFPHRSLYAGSVTDPFPVRIVGDPGKGSVGSGQ